MYKRQTEFWKRWHITLGRALSTYVYIPLGGNRKGMVRQVRNILVVWLLTGISVSYTHLDVYKRQADDSSRPIRNYP